MKKLVFLFICVLIANKNYGQIPVTDVANAANIGAVNGSLGVVNSNLSTGNSKAASILAKAILQVKELVALKDKYTEQMSFVKEVNGYISQGKQIGRIKNSISDITNEYSSAIRMIKSQPEIDATSKGVLLEGYSKKLTQSLDIFSDASAVLNDDLKMNDAERLTILNNADEKLRKQLSFLIYLRKKIEHNVNVKRQSTSSVKFLNDQSTYLNRLK